MRMQAKVQMQYAGKDLQPGDLFDALREDGLDLRNKEMANPFHLEDPATRLDALQAVPSVPTVRIAPTSASPTAAGGSASFAVSITGPGLSGTWTVTQDASATWISIVSPTTPQSADGPVNYTVSANAGAQRTGNMYVNGKTFTVTQAAGSRERHDG